MSAERHPDRVRVQLNVRLPVDVHTAMTQMAERSIRTLNGQITYALRQWLAAQPDGANGAEKERDA